MKKSDINSVLPALRKVRLDKVDDKDLRKLLVDDTIVLARAARDLENDIHDAGSVMDAYKEEAQRVEELRSQLLTSADSEEQNQIAREINGHTAYFAAQREFTERQDEILRQEVEGVKPIDLDTFRAATEKADITLDQFAALVPLFDDGKSKAKKKK